MKKLIRNNLFLIFVIFVFAFTLRIWNLAKYPDAIDEDEMANGYYAFSLLKNGTDEYGHKFPIYFESVKDYKYGLYSYFSIPAVEIFGLNTFSARFMACLAGSLTVVAIYFLALEIFPSTTFALISSSLLAITPFHIHFSRVGYSNVLGSLFSILSILFFIKFLKKIKTKNAVLSFFFLVLSIFTYQTYRVYLPVSFILLFCIYNPIQIIKQKKWNVILFVIGSLLIVLLSFIPKESRKRAHSFDELIDRPALVEQYSEDSLMQTKILTTRVFHNKYLSFFKAFTERYFSYFDPRFLFIETSTTTERHSIPNVGFVYFIDTVFILMGISFIFSKIKNNNKYIPFILLFAAPLAASMTMEPRSVTRSIIMVTPLMFLSAFGVYSLFESKKLKKYFLLLAAIAYTVGLFGFIHQYTVHKVIHHPWYSDVGLKEMVEGVNKNYEKYSNIVVAQGHYIPFLFFNKVDPKLFLEESIISQDPNDGVRVKEYGKIIFNMPYNCPLAGKENVLYICFGYQIPKNSKIVDLIRFKDGQPAIILIEFGSEDDKLPERVSYFNEVDTRFPTSILPLNYDKFWPISN